MTADSDGADDVDEDVHLAPERRRYVLDLYGRLDAMSYYELLGVERSADQKLVKQAFFRLASMLHPDRYFGRKLGSFRPKLEAIFARVMIANDTLGDPAMRAEYDAELGPPSHQEATRGSDPEPPSSPELDVERRRQAARAALQQRFGDPKARAVERARLAKRHVDAAAIARVSGDLQAAAEFLRLAIALAPEDAALRTAYESAKAAADERLAESHARQAVLEEKYGHWAEAAASWERVLSLSPGHPGAATQLAIALERSRRPR